MAGGMDWRDFQQAAMREQQLAIQKVLGRPCFEPLLKNPYDRSETMLEKLKNIDRAAGGEEVERLVELAAYGRSLALEFDMQQIPAPKWLTTNLAFLGREIKARYRSQKETELRALEDKIERLKSQEEQRQDAMEKAKALREELEIK